MATVKRTTPVRTRAATQKLIEQLTESLEAIEVKLKDMLVKQEAFLQISYVSMAVRHNTYGEGIITEQNEDIVKVNFPNTGFTKTFVIHRKFTNRPTFEQDEETITAFSEYADRRLAINHLKQEKIRLEKQRAEMLEE